MGCSSWFNRQSVRCQLLSGLLSITLVVFIIAFPVYIGLATKTRDDLISGSKDILTRDVVSKTTSILDEKVGTLVNLLDQNEEGFLKMVGYTIQYTSIGGGVSMFPVDSYPDNDLADLKPPVLPNNRSGGSSVSLGASSVYFVEQFPNGSNIPDLMATHGTLVNETSHIDLYCIQLFQNYTDVVAVYYGDNTTGFFRKYPGHSTKLTDPTRSYDPRARPWYTKAVSITGNVSITDPYLDAFGLGWMVTMSFKVVDISGSLMGVVGIDLLIDTIQTNILNFQLDDSKSYLIQENDVVLSAPEWTPTLASGTLFMVTNITETPIPSVWDSIKANKNGNTEAGDYIIIYKNVHFGDQSYYYVTAVPQSTALKSVLDHQSSLEDDIDELILLDVFLLLGAMGFVLIVILISVHLITRPIERAKRLANDVGNAVVSGNGLQGLNAELTSAMRTGNGGGESSSMYHSMASAFSSMANQSNTMMVPDLPPTYDQAQGGAPPMPTKSAAGGPLPTAPPPPSNSGGYGMTAI